MHILSGLVDLRKLGAVTPDPYANFNVAGGADVVDEAPSVLVSFPRNVVRRHQDRCGGQCTDTSS